MTVALVLAAEADAGMCGQLAALGVRRVDLAGSGSNGAGLLTVAAAARTAGEKVIICVGDGPVPGDILARLLTVSATAVYNGGSIGYGLAGAEPAGALVVDTPHLDDLADAAETLASRPAAAVPPSKADQQTRAQRARATDPLGALVSELAVLGVPTRVLDAGPDGEGEVAQRLADPVARDVAHWALARTLTPEALCGMAIGLGLIAAVWLTSNGIVADVIAMIALAASFVADRSASLVAASGRWATPAIDWLAASSALLIECGLYCALAVHPGDGLFARGPSPNWHLAMAAMAMLAMRRLAELGFDRACDEQGLRRTVLRPFEQAITLPTGERYLVIALVTVLAGPRDTFWVLLGWGAGAIAYLLTGRVAGALLATVMMGPAEPAEMPGAIGDIAAFRNDGMLAHWIGGLVQGRLPPLLPALVGVLVTSVLAGLGMADLPGLLILTPVEAMLLAGLGACHPHDGKRDWFAPPLLLAGEFVYIGAMGLAHGVPAIMVFLLLVAIVLRHIDVAYRARHYAGISADVLGLGWDGRMLLLGLATMLGIAPFAYVAVSGYLWLLFGWDFLGGWLTDATAQAQMTEEAAVDEEELTTT